MMGNRGSCETVKAGAVKKYMSEANTASGTRRVEPKGMGAGGTPVPACGWGGGPRPQTCEACAPRKGGS